MHNYRTLAIANKATTNPQAETATWEAAPVNSSTLGSEVPLDASGTKESPSVASVLAATGAEAATAATAATEPDGVEDFAELAATAPDTAAALPPKNVAQPPCAPLVFPLLMLLLVFFDHCEVSNCS